jgi:hypothetical protein
VHYAHLAHLVFLIHEKTIIQVITIFFGSFLLISNAPSLKALLEAFLSKPYYYTTKSHGFNARELKSKGLTYDRVISQFEEFKTVCKQLDAKLYRTFKVKLYKIWLWGEYIYHPKYRLSYFPLLDGYHYDLLNFWCA